MALKEHITTPNSFHLPPDKILVGDSLENLEKLQDMNSKGQNCLVAPNHIKPTSSLRENMAIADDFPEMKRIFAILGVGNLRPVARGDMDLAIGTSKAKHLAYSIHQRLYSEAGRSIVGSFPININRDEPEIAAQENIANLRRIVRALNSTETPANIVIYPYGNWFDSGQQNFSEEDIWPPKHSTMVRPGDPEFDRWRASMKRGTFGLSRMTESPIFPVYMARHEGKTYLRVGAPILPSEHGFDESRIQKAYIHAMQNMKEETLQKQKIE